MGWDHGIRAAARMAVGCVLASLGGLASAQYASIDRIVAFGSSLSDTGNAFVWLSDPANAACGTKQNVPPFDALDDNLTPDGPYATGGHHVTNGATWVEVLARRLALPGNMRPALRHGAEASNYAVFGARGVAHPCRLNLADQVGAYLTDFPSTSPRTLFAIEIGSNDVRDALLLSDPIGHLQAVLASLGQQVGTLYAYGARKFLFVNVPNIGKTPAVRQLDVIFPGLAAGATRLAYGFNIGLAGVVQFAAALGADARVLDSFAIVDQVIADPAAYGMTNVTESCLTPGVAPYRCATPDRYVFWDGIHPTKAMHAIVGRLAIDVVLAP